MSIFLITKNTIWDASPDYMKKRLVMRIEGISNAHTLNNNQTAGGNIKSDFCDDPNRILKTTNVINAFKQSPIQKIIENLKMQMQKIKESDAPAEIKSEQIKALEERIAELRQQFLEELAKKSTGEADADKRKKDEKTGTKEDESEKRLLEKGFSVINTDTVQGIVSSAGSMDLAAKAHEQYVKAKIRQDGKAMSSAMKFQTSFTRQAVKSAAQMQSSEAETSKGKAAAVAAYKNNAKPNPEDKKSSPLEISI